MTTQKALELHAGTRVLSTHELRDMIGRSGGEGNGGSPQKASQDTSLKAKVSNG